MENIHTFMDILVVFMDIRILIMENLAGLPANPERRRPALTRDAGLDRAGGAGRGWQGLVGAGLEWLVSLECLMFTDMEN